MSNSAQVVQQQDSKKDEQTCMEHVRNVLRTINTVRYITNAIEQLGTIPWRDERVKCVSLQSLPNTSLDTDGNPLAQAGYVWQDVYKYRQQPAASSQLPEKSSTNGDENSNGAASSRSIDGGENSSDGSRPPQQTLRHQRGDILILAHRGQSQADIERNLRHELIHAFDDARGFLDPSNCYHQACSEIRAARLSGDCFASEEFRRGHFGLSSGKRCVERRAALAVERNPMCRGSGERAVGATMVKCYRDYEPFVAPLYSMGSYHSVHGPPSK